MLLIIDVGNTRLKYALYDNDQQLWLTSPSVVAMHDIFETDFKKIWHDIPIPDAVYCSNVAGDEVGQFLRQHVASIFGCSYFSVKSSATFFNIKNGYVSPEQLGVDRWLQLIAAARLYPNQALLVVSFGTVITLDVMQADGQHVGGYILPSLSLMQHSICAMAHGCKDLEVNREPVMTPAEALNYGVSTTSAIEAGTSQMLIQYLLAEICKLKQKYSQAVCVLSGGGAQHIAPYLGKNVKLYPWLVLEGLAVYGTNHIKSLASVH